MKQQQWEYWPSDVFFLFFFFNAPMHARIQMMMGIVSNNDGGISLTMMETSYMEMGQDQQHWGLIYLTNKRGGIFINNDENVSSCFPIWMEGDEHSATSNNCKSSNRIQGRRQGAVGDMLRQQSLQSWNAQNSTGCRDCFIQLNEQTGNAGTTSTNCPCEAPCLPNLPPAPDFLRRESWFHDFHSLSSMERSWTFAPARKSESAACAGRVRASMRHWCVVAFDDAWRWFPLFPIDESLQLAPGWARSKSTNR